MKNSDLINLLNRARAHIEAPADLKADGIEQLAVDLGSAVTDLKLADAGPVTVSETTLYVHAEGEASDSEDDEVPGIYAVSVSSGVPVACLASAALDIFHGHVAVDVLDDFNFTVYSADGAPVEDSVTLDGYEFIDRGSIDGKVDAETLGWAPGAAASPTL